MLLTVPCPPYSLKLVEPGIDVFVEVLERDMICKLSPSCRLECHTTG